MSSYNSSSGERPSRAARARNGVGGVGFVVRRVAQLPGLVERELHSAGFGDVGDDAPLDLQVGDVGPALERGGAGPGVDGAVEGKQSVDGAGGYHPGHF